MLKSLKFLLPLAFVFLSLPLNVNAQEATVAGSIDLDYASKIITLENIIADGNFDISPTVFKVDAGRGESFTYTIYVTSRSNEDSEFYIVTEDYEGSPTSASSHILMGDGESAYGARSWITPAYSEFKLGLGERLPLEITINVPQDADPGEHYAAVLVARKPKALPDNGVGNNVQITSRIGAMFMINVDGAFKADGHIEDFAAKPLQSTSANSLITKQPFDFVITYRNEGNVHLTPHGSVSLKNLFGHTVPVINQINPKAAHADALTINGFNVLRDAARTVYIPSQNDVEAMKLLFGPYTATLTLDNGLGQIETAEISFWYLPMPGTIIVLIILLILIIVITVLIKKKQIAKKRKKAPVDEKQPSTTTKN